MSVFRFCLVFTLFLGALKTRAQVTFTLVSSVCEGGSASVTADTGTLSISSYTWSALPAGAVFSSPNSSHSNVIFNAPGTYTLLLGVTTGTGDAFATNTIVVHPNPTVTISATDPIICFGKSSTLTAGGASNYTWEPQSLIFVISPASVYVSPLSTSGFTVAGTNSLGCVGIGFYTVDVVNYPNLALLPTSLSVCAGYASTITAFGAQTYSWTGSSLPGTITTSVIAVGAGTYTLTGSNGGDCTAFTTINIAIGPPLNITASASRTVLCINDSIHEPPVVLSASGAATYVWEPYLLGYMSYSIGPSTAVTPTASTCYTVTASDIGCSVRKVICVSVSDCTGIEELEKEGTKDQFVLFPNPANDHLFIFSKKGTTATVEITDLVGKIILSEKRYFAGDAKQNFDLDGFSQGMYLVKIKTDEGQYQVVHLVRH